LLTRLLWKRPNSVDLPGLFFYLFKSRPSRRNEFANVQTIIHQFKALQQPDPDGHHERIACPTIILTGSEDGTHQNAFALKQGNCDLKVLPGGEPGMPVR
jgi:pimeloyl-ACP methyl ester carboxylesterase